MGVKCASQEAGARLKFEHTKAGTMKKGTHFTTNYTDTFIEVAEDTNVSCGTVPPSKGDQKTIAGLQYKLLAENPYTRTSDDLIFDIFALRNGLEKAMYNQAREQFFSKGQPCLRTSPLAKRYGFGIHADSEGKVAIYGMETKEYEKLQNDPALTKIKAVRSKKG